MPAPNTAALAARAARRALLRDGIQRGGRALSVGAAGGLILVGADTLFGGLLWPVQDDGARWPYLLGIPGALGLGAGLTLAIARRWRADRAVLEVDRALGLKERLSSGLALAAGASGGAGFEALAIRDAESTASAVRLSLALPIRPAWTWAVWPALIAGGAGVATLVPRVEWRSPANSPVASADQAGSAAAQVRDAADAARDAIKQTLADRGLMDVATTEQLKQLESLERELVASGAGAGQARVKAAESLDSLADQLQARAKDDQAAHDALRERLAGAESPVDGAAAPLAEALRAGDMARAQQAAQEMMSKLGGMSEADRRALSRDLERLADQVKGGAQTESPDRPGEPALPSSSSATEPLGPSPVDSPSAQDFPARSAPSDGPADASAETRAEPIREQPDSQGVPPEQSDRPAEDIARQNQKRRASEQAQRDAEALRQSLRDAARRVSGSEGANQPQPGEQEAQRPADSAPPADELRPGEQSKADPRPRPEDRTAANRDAPNGEQSKPSAGAGEKPDRAGRSGADNAGQRPGQGTTEGGRESREKPEGQKGSGAQTEKGGGEDKSGGGNQPQDTSRPGVKTPGAPTTGQGAGDKQGKESRTQGEGGGGSPDEKADGRRRDNPGGGTGDQSGPAGDLAADKPADGSAGEPGQRDGGPDPRGSARKARPGEGQGRPKADRGDESPRPQEGGQGRPGAEPSAQPRGQPGTDGATEPGWAEGRRGEDTEGSGPGEADPASDGPDGGTSGGRGFRGLQEQLDQLAERQRSAKEAPRLSRSLRERAQKLLEQASPEERESLERWGRQAAREQPGPSGGALRPQPSRAWDGPTEVVDARTPELEPAEGPSADQSERVIAEWFSNQGIDRTGATTGAQMTRQIQKAREGAERAIEQQTVPRRDSELIRRIFRRYTQRAAGERPPLPAVDAPDAEPSNGGGK